MPLTGLASYGMVCSAIMLKNVDVIIVQKADATTCQNAGNNMISYCVV